MFGYLVIVICLGFKSIMAIYKGQDLIAGIRTNSAPGLPMLGQDRVIRS